MILNDAKTSPLIHLVCFLILASFMAFGNTAILVLSLLIIAGLYFYAPPPEVKKIVKNIFRLKWLYLSIFLVYLLPLREGMWLSSSLHAAHRVLILMSILLLLGWILQRSSRENLVQALIQLLSPCQWFGLPIHTLALRIQLLFAELESVRQIIAETLGDVSFKKFQFGTVSEKLAGIYHAVVSSEPQSDFTNVDTVTIEVDDYPHLSAWLLPSILMLLLVTVQVLF